MAPGFIDLLSYEPNGYGEWFKVADGVTTNLGMHGLNAEATEFLQYWTATAPFHFGGAYDAVPPGDGARARHRRGRVVVGARPAGR